jgi:hypothetical protein
MNPNGNYDEDDQDNFTNRICGYCGKDFDLKDPHYYNEEVGECYCNEECYKKETEIETEMDKVYQVRVYYNEQNSSSCFFQEDENGKWEFDTFEEAFDVFSKYIKDEDDEMIILTETPKASCEECDNYEIKEILIFSKKN